MISLLLIINIIISIIHPLKYLPQIIHIIETESVDDISMCYLNIETLLNILTLIIFIKITLGSNNLIYFIPNIGEKILSLVMILYLSYLKNKFTNNQNIENELSIEDTSDDIYNTWRSVESIE